MKNWTDLLTIFISLLAFLVSWRSYVLAKKAHAISEDNHQNQLKQITPYLIDSLKWKEDEHVYVSFAISYTNEATIQNSISNISLKLTFNSVKKTYPELSVPATDKIPKTGNYKALTIPMLLTGRETKSGWITFELPKTAIKETTVETYTLVAETATGNKVQTITSLVNYVLE